MPFAKRPRLSLYGEPDVVVEQVEAPRRRSEPRGEAGEDGRGVCANPRCRQTEPGRLDGRVPLCVTGYCVLGCCVAATFPTEHADAGCECWGEAADDLDDED